MKTHEMTPHRARPPSRAGRVAASISASDPNWLLLRWHLEGAADIAVPHFAGRHRADGLWRNTCFELFVKPPGGEAYSEFNFSPSEQWAAYDFTSYRAGMRDREACGSPVSRWRGGRSGRVIFDVAIRLADLPPLPWRYALCAVIEEEGGHMSYWAMEHPADQPDFHHPACFTGRLEAPEAP